MEINNLFESLKVDLTCHICLGYFTEPVIVPCGHSFCNECILNYWKETHTQVTCPICKSVLVFEDFFYNTRLKNLAIIGKILRPYLLQSIRPLTTCTKHGKEEIWFCEEDHRLFCGPCFLSMEHKEHKVLPLEKAAGQCMEKLQAKWNILKDKKQKLRMELEREKRREVQCKEHGPTLKELIRHEYEKMHWFLLEEEWLEFQKQYKVARGSLPVNENKDSQSQGILSLQPVEMLKLDGETMIELVKSQYEKKHQLLSEEQHLHLQRLDQQVEENLAKFVESKAKMTQQIHNLQKVMSEIDKTFDKLPTDLLQG
ncbi:probable E3 ubiquitin-protein ligase TRIML1 [Dromiciops gliroides]|uniref:probable E3 ubiquitin-protein ligase TRIML1 n=1 Tax=Dromiciops gliroides TaxID=33562 RepID=UPI001CC419C7|nr:probable E3 ubiquitin-protein ligase TRIML1 [Dromiciops gliroides]